MVPLENPVNHRYSENSTIVGQYIIGCYNFTFRTLSSMSTSCTGGSAKLARRGVTLTQPLCIAQPSDPGGRVDKEGVIRLFISGDHLNTRSPDSSDVGPQEELSTLVRSVDKESGPAALTVHLETRDSGVETAWNSRPYEFRHILVQQISNPWSSKSPSINGMFTLYRSASPLRPPWSSPQLCQR